MKNLLLILCILVTPALQAQLRLTGKFTHAEPGEKVKVNVPYDVWYHKQNTHEVALDDKGAFAFTVPVKKPQTIFFDFAGERLYLYAEPGKDLTLQADARDFNNSLKFKGKLGTENNFHLQTGLTFHKLYPQPWNDTITSPDEILVAIQASQAAALEKLKSGRLKNATYTRLTEADITWFATSKVLSLIEKNEVWSVGKTSSYSREAWQEVLKAAYELQSLSDPGAIGSYHYGKTVAYYPRYLELTNDNFEQLAEKIHQKPFAEISNEVRAKGKNFWEYSVINYGLEGAALETGIASFLTNAVQSGEVAYLPEAYDDFQNRFPDSRYRQHLEEVMKPLLISLQQNEHAGIELDENSGSYTSLEEIAAAHKGKVIYVDMWGSWCGPCREQFRYTPALKDRFRGKDVAFVYIAFEHSANPEKTWKETIAFYNLQGRHILGSSELEAYFRKLYAAKGTLLFPSYLLLNKAGKIITLHAEQPAAGNKLYRQIEELLK